MVFLTIFRLCSPSKYLLSKNIPFLLKLRIKMRRNLPGKTKIYLIKVRSLFLFGSAIGFFPFFKNGYILRLRKD